MTVNELQEEVNKIFGIDRYIIISIYMAGRQRKCKIYCPVCDTTSDRRVAHVLNGHKCKSCGSQEGSVRRISLSQKQAVLNQRIPNNTITISYPVREKEGFSYEDKRILQLQCSKCGTI